jgi:hypothetical protein
MPDVSFGRDCHHTLVGAMKRQSRLRVGDYVTVNVLVTGRVQSLGTDSTGAWVSVETIEGTMMVPLAHVQKTTEEGEKP